MIDALLFQHINCKGEKAWMYRATTLPALPPDGTLLYVGGKPSDWFEVEVSSTAMRSGVSHLLVMLRGFEWTAADDGDDPIDLTRWIENYETYGFRRCDEPDYWTARFTKFIEALAAARAPGGEGRA